jgi:SprT protein
LHKFTQELKRNDLTDAFAQFVPLPFVDYCVDLLMSYKVALKVKASRTTKSGDYRPPVGGRKQHQVTLNDDLNPYHFLLVYIHEMAHVKTWEDYGRKVMPHGNEWRENFKAMAVPVLESGLLPDELTKALKRFFINTPASFMSDSKLMRVLKQWDTEEKVSKIFLEDLPSGTKFKLENGMALQKEKKLRTWYLCKDLITTKVYKVRGNAEVVVIT